MLSEVYIKLMLLFLAIYSRDEYIFFYKLAIYSYTACLDIYNLYMYVRMYIE